MTAEDFNSLSIFQDLSLEQRAIVEKLIQPEEVPIGTMLFEQGDLADTLYIVTDGEVQIRYKPEDGPELIVARVREQGVVGWSAALGSPTYTSSAVCSSDCHLLRLRGRDLRDLYARDPETGKLVLERLATVIAERLRNTHHHVLAMLERGMRMEINKSIAAS
jgi:CRP-like cAMP-binding protein